MSLQLFFMASYNLDQFQKFVTSPQFLATYEIDPELLGDALIGSPVTSDDLDPRLPQGGLNLKQHLSSLEVNYIRQALEESGGVVAHAAKRLGMRRTTLVEKLRKYGLQRSSAVS
jgi:sigma-54 specific flagellar transcriptional regulator A